MTGLVVNPAMPLVLGTAQLGGNYGIANRAGKPVETAQYELLDLAIQLGVSVIDTAPAYGDAEEVIGRWMARTSNKSIKVISKLDRRINPTDAAAVTHTVRNSASRLGRPLDGFLLHDSASLRLWSRGLGEALLGCRERGLIGELGVSTYTPEEFRAALSIKDLTLIQAPFNVFDQRLSRMGLLERAILTGKTVFLRSAFLQGLLILDEHELPADMKFANREVRTWQRVCAEHHAAPADTALRFVRHAAPKAGIVVGCDTPDQLRSNVACIIRGPLDRMLAAAVAALATDEERLVDPRAWPQPQSSKQVVDEQTC